MATADLAHQAPGLAVLHERPYAEALHLALALRERCPFVTADDRLFATLAPVFPRVLHLQDVVT